MLAYIKNNIRSENDKYNEFIDGVFNSIDIGYGDISAYHHTPKSKESFAKISTVSPSVDLENWIFSIHSINICLYNINSLYVLYYPMALHPVDVIKRFGFNGPMGIFTDKWNYKTLEKYFGSERCKTFLKMTNNSEDIKAKLDWLNGQKELTKEEILETYNIEYNDKEDIKLPIEQIYIKQKSKIRGIALFFSYIHEDEKVEDLTEEEQTAFDFIYKEY
jgi:hypothetical protein